MLAVSIIYPDRIKKNRKIKFFKVIMEHSNYKKMKFKNGIFFF